MRHKLTITIFLALMCVSLIAVAQETKLLSDIHSDAGIECIDCHGVADPVKKASAKACKSCHGDMTDAEEISFKDTAGGDYTLNPHNAHPGSIRCTLCHSSHEPSKLYCNTCHKFELQVP